MSGAYALGRNILATSPFAGPCILVAADFVSIDLAGFLILGVGTDVGIASDGSRRGIAVRNGSIVNFSAGIDLSASSHAQIDAVRVIGNNGNGAVLGTDSTVTNSTFSANQQTGLIVFQGSLVRGNTARDNGTSGVFAGMQIHCPTNLLQNTLTNNSGGGLSIVGALCNIEHNVLGP